MIAPTPTRRRWLPWLVSLGLTVGLFWYLLSQVEPGEIARAATNMAPRSLVMFLVFLLGGVVARALRFWILLGRVVRLRVMLAVTLVRNLFVDLLPARLGELSYVYLVTERAGRPVEEGLASLFLAVLFDIVALAPLIVIALLVVGGGGEIPTEVLVGASVALAGVAWLALRFAEPVADWTASLLASRARTEFLSRIAEKLEATAAALRQTRARGVFGLVLGISLVVRVCKIGSFYSLVVAALTPMGYAVADVGLFRVLLGVVGAELAAALPVHGIAGFGTYEAAWTISFVQVGFEREHAIISGILAHAISQVTEYTMGALAFLWLMRPALRTR